MCLFQVRSHFASVILSLPHVVGVTFVIFTLVCVTPFYITKFSPSAPLGIIWSYISLEYALDTIL